MKDEGVTTVYILNDNEVYGKGVAANTKTAVEELGIEVAGEDSWDGKAANYRALASKVKSSGADAVFTGGIIDNNGPQLFKDLHAAVPDAKLFGPDGMATVDFTKEIPAEVQAKTFLTAPTVSPDELPPAGQKFYDDFSAEYGEPADEIDPYADLRLRGRPRRPRLDRAGRGRPAGRHRRLLRDREQGVAARHLLDRRRRRHDPDHLRRVHRQGRQARVQQGDRAAGRISANR